jgi:outer membrane protein assembly factor BamB
LWFGDDSTHLLHLDANQGTLISTYTMPAKFNTCSNNSYGIIYAGSIDGKVYAVNGMSLYGNFDTQAPVINSASVHNNNIYACSANKLYCLEDGSLSENWEYDNEDAIQASAVYFGNNNGQVYITSKGNVTAVDAHTGQLTWRFHTLSTEENMTSVCLADKRGNVSYPAESGNYTLNH